MPHRNPTPTVDVLIEMPDGIVFVERKNPPHGWALPGGFVDEGETVEAAAVREAKEEVGLDVRLKGLLHVYSDPQRDPRQHTLSTVFVATAQGEPKAGDDAALVKVARPEAPPSPLAFDHEIIVRDYLRFRDSGKRPLEH